MDVSGFIFSIGFKILESFIKSKMQAKEKIIRENELRLAIARELERWSLERHVFITQSDAIVSEVYSIANSSPLTQVKGADIIIHRGSLKPGAVREFLLRKRVKKLHAKIDEIVADDQESIQIEIGDSDLGSDASPIPYPFSPEARDQPESSNSSSLKASSIAPLRRSLIFQQDDQANSESRRPERPLPIDALVAKHRDRLKQALEEENQDEPTEWS